MPLSRDQTRAADVRDGRIDRARCAYHHDLVHLGCGPLSMADPPVGAPIDSNGNMTGDGTRTCEWDAENRLTAITIGSQRSEFSYDGNDRRVRVVERTMARSLAMPV